MPNYVSNRAIIRHSDPAKLALLDTAYQERNLFSTILPCPTALLGTPSGRYADPVKQAAMEKEQAENRKQYGYSTAYEWRVENWSTKWEAITNEQGPLFREGDTELVLEFETAWAPPTSIYKALRQQGYDVTYDWWEEWETEEDEG
jgi:hypothetical protein